MPIKRVPVTLPSIFALLFFLGGTALADATRLSESGSTLLYPLMNSWANAYSDDHPDVAIDTFASGSGAGIAAAISGSTQLGASDAPLKDSQLEQQGTRMLNIPVAVSAQQVNFNVPELNGVTLKLNGTVLAGIYTGAIAMWDDRRIAALNAGTLLPHRGIIPIRRAEGSGDTYIFTQYLSLSDPDWNLAVPEPHFATHIAWPSLKSMLLAKGNSGMVELCRNTRYSIAYVGISYFEQAKGYGLGVAALESRSGEFLLPTAENVGAAVSAVSGQMPTDGRLSLTYLPARGAYPIVNFEYAIVRQTQTVAGVAAELRDFLSWIVDPKRGNAASYLDPVHFAPLPESVLRISRAQITSIQGP